LALSAAVRAQFNYTVNDGQVTSIGAAFRYQSSLTRVLIPASVTSIGNEAFHSCVNLASVSLGSNVTSIGDSAFAGCNRLTSLTIPDSVTALEARVFSGTAHASVNDEASSGVEPLLKLIANEVSDSHASSSSAMRPSRSTRCRMDTTSIFGPKS
jgi:hypothetical protein